MKICSARNFLLLNALLLLYGFALGPYIAWHQRDQNFDIYNIYQKSDYLSFELFHCQAPIRSNQFKLDCKSLWLNNSILYQAQKFLLNQTFEIPISSNIRKNLTNLYLLLKVKQRDCKSGCAILQQQAQLLRWVILPPRTSHILISNEPKPTEMPSPTPQPYRYKTTRFDLLDNDILNTQTLLPWSSDQLMIDRRKRSFRPILSVDSFYNIDSQRRLIDLNRTNFTVNVVINIRGQYIWNMKNSIQYTIDMLSQNYQTEIFEASVNELKRAYIETNPILLWTTIVFQILHSIFQVLAFEKDVEFWTKKESLIGVSLRTILLQFGGSIILFLNLFESRKIPLFIKIIDFGGLCVHVYKIFRLIAFSKHFPFIEVRSEYKGETNDADEAGLRYLSYVLGPLLIVYSVYQLLNVEYRSVKSYLLHCLSGAVYSFGFLAMLPQLYVNYRLKTVAGMSRNAFIYKFITTFIDDLYTFVSDLPLMYKIACFRDDVVFFIWIFQCFIYPVDPTRANEFGFVEKQENEKESKKKESNPNDNNESNSKDQDESKDTQKKTESSEENITEKVKTD